METNDYPEVRAWVDRGGAAPWVPGKPEETLACLRAVLRAVDENTAPDAVFSWPSGGTTPMREAVQPLSTSGLVAREGTPARFVLTTAGRRFLDDGDEDFLIATFHAHIRFFGEILRELGDGTTHPDLNTVAKEKYGLAWNSLDQVRRRVHWLRATGMVDFWTNNRIVPTERGRALLARLAPEDPADLVGAADGDDEPVTLPTPPPLLAADLDGLDDAALRARSRGLGYIAGGISTATIRRLVEEALSPIPKARFVTLCSEMCQVAASSGEQTLNTFRSLGLMEQVGPDAFRATPIVAEWASSGDPLDFVRILHGRVALVGELLDVMPARADAGRITRALASAYPALDLSRDEINRRLVFLNEAGLVERLGNLIRRTRAGTAFAESVRLLPSSADDQDDHDHEAAATDHRATIRQLRERVVEAALDSARPRVFETVLADAFRALGFDVEHHSGPSRTDVLISVWESPTERITVAVEAKTDGDGVVTAQDVELPALAEHRTRHGASMTLVVGPSFNSRLTRWVADEDDVVLVTARQVADLLGRQARAPLYPREFNALLTKGDHEAQERVWRRVERRQSVVAHVLDIMWKSANDPVDIEYGEGALGVSEIWRESKTLLDNPMDRSEIEEALAFLSTPLLSAVRRAGQNHVVTTSPTSVAARLRVLADMIESPGSTADTEAYRIAAPQPVTEEPRATRQDVSPAAVRAWAAANGRVVSQRGRLSTTLIDAFVAANEGGQPKVNE